MTVATSDDLCESFFDTFLPVFEKLSIVEVCDLMMLCREGGADCCRISITITFLGEFQ